MNYAEAIRALKEAGELEAVRILKELRESKKAKGVERRARVAKRLTAAIKEEVWDLYTSTNLSISKIANMVGAPEKLITEFINGRQRDPRFHDN